MTFSLSFEDDREDPGTGVATITYNSGGDPSIGAADSTRVVVVAVGGRTVSAVGISSMTIGGISATQIPSAFIAENAVIIADAWYAAVPTGTTATVTIVWAAAMIVGATTCISTWSIIGSTGTPSSVVNASAAANGSGPQPLTLPALTVPGGGAALSVYFNRAGLSPTMSWSSATQDFAFVADPTNGSRFYSGAHTTTTGSVTITATDSDPTNTSTNESVMLAVAWTPATPAQFGWQLDPQFPFRVRPRLFQSSDDEWFFTATPNPLKWQGIEPPPQFPIRKSRSQLVQDDPHFIPVVPPPVLPLFEPQMPVRRRFDPMQSQDDQFLFTSVATPAQFGWDNPEHFPLRRRLPTFQQADEHWPFTAIPAPAQFGWQIDPQFAQRVRFRPQLTPVELPFVPPGVLTPSNIDFAYPPEFYIERRRYQPLIYEFWQPDIPPASPQFQLMGATATKLRTSYGATLFNIQLQGTGAFVFNQTTSPGLLNDALPFGSAHIVLTSGSTPVSVALAVSNDGVNFIQLGLAVTNFPTIIDLTAVSTLLSTMPYSYHAWVVTGGDATTQLAITEIFMGWRG